MSDASFAGLNVIVVGGGQGLGRQYCLDLAARGANVAIVSRSARAEAVAREIEAAGARGLPFVCDAADAQSYVRATVDALGSVDAVIVNAGITRDRTFMKMNDEEWSDVLNVHLGSSYACAKACWPQLCACRGAILFTVSSAALFGGFGQSNYAAAKGAILGLMRSLALEGAKYGVRVNAISPTASTAMTSGVFTAQMKARLHAQDVSPVALAMIHPRCTASGQVIQAAGGFAAALRWQRSAGAQFDDRDPATILARWSDIVDFDAGFDVPNSTAESIAPAMGVARAMRRAMPVD
jgi:NAD(P)-dependent dehydrogenase (short-subunit alcohol dehydrogenase family)